MCGREDEREIDILSLAGTEIVTDTEELGVANHFVDSSETQFGHDGSEFIGNIVKEVDDMFWRSVELGAKLRILGSNTNRAGVEMAFCGRLAFEITDLNCS
jgi:hypothetical protein